MMIKLKTLLYEAITDNPNFKKWFGNSKVIDASGKPLVVYHGTNQPIKTFSKKRLGTSTQSQSSKKAFFFTDNPDVAGAYAAKAGSTMRANLATYEKKVKEFQKKIERLERHAQVTGNWEPYEKAVEEYESYDINSSQADDVTGQNILAVYLKIENPLVKDFEKDNYQLLMELPKFIDFAVQNGYDGLILKNVTDPTPTSTHYVVFKPTQIKSVFNKGEYNPKDSNVTSESTDYEAIQENVDAPPAIHQQAQNFDRSFVDYIKMVENGVKMGFDKKSGKWFPHRSPEGGFPTVAYGHKLTSTQDVKKFKEGITDSEATSLLMVDLEKAKQTVYKDIKSMYNVNIPLNRKQEEMLVDFAFNLGNLKKFPKFVKAVLNNDVAEMKREFKRSSGHKELTSRNQEFEKRFLK